MISIIITAYNVAEYIEQSINSALNQTYNDIEVIVVLDKPTDNTTEIVKSINNPKLRIIENKENVGAGMSRRIGIEHANGEFISFLDGDDWLEPNFLVHLISSQKETNADITCSGVIYRKLNGICETTKYINLVSEGYNKFINFCNQRIVGCTCKLIKKSLFDKVQYCGRRYIEDLPTMLKLIYYANKLVFIDKAEYNIRQNKNSLTNSANYIKEFIYQALCYLDVIEFFNKVDPKVYEYTNFNNYKLLVLQQLNEHEFTMEEIQPYITDWIEFTIRFFNLNKFNND